MGLAGLAVALLGPVVGAIADHGGGQRRWLTATTALCVLPTAALWWVMPHSPHLIGALLLVGLATIGMELASVFYNALLPRLAASDAAALGEDIIAARAEIKAPADPWA